MFCDLVGSTALASQLDAEDWRSLVNAYLDEATNAVTGLGGHVLKKLCDGLMVLFGYRLRPSASLKFRPFLPSEASSRGEPSRPAVT